MSSLSHAQTNNDLLSKCDAALQARAKQTQICEQRVLLRDQEIERLVKANIELQKQNEPGFFDNPLVVGALGMVLGAFLISKTR